MIQVRDTFLELVDLGLLSLHEIELHADLELDLIGIEEGPPCSSWTSRSWAPERVAQKIFSVRSGSK